MGAMKVNLIYCLDMAAGAVYNRVQKQTCLRGRAVIRRSTEVSGANGLNYKLSEQVTFGSCFKKAMAIFYACDSYLQKVLF